MIWLKSGIIEISIKKTFIGFWSVCKVSREWEKRDSVSTQSKSQKWDENKKSQISCKTSPKWISFILHLTHRHSDWAENKIIKFMVRLYYLSFVQPFFNRATHRKIEMGDIACYHHECVWHIFLTGNIRSCRCFYCCIYFDTLFCLSCLFFHTYV